MKAAMHVALFLVTVFDYLRGATTEEEPVPDSPHHADIEQEYNFGRSEGYERYKSEGVGEGNKGKLLEEEGEEEEKKEEDPRQYYNMLEANDELERWHRDR